MIKADEVFNPRDFESIRLHLYFTNTTTRTEVRDPKKVQLLELGEKWLILELPDKSCNSKHNVVVVIKRVTNEIDKNTKKKREVQLLSTTGKVFDVEEVGDETLRVTIECLQFDEKSWQELHEMYSKRQADIENFFAAVKG